MSHSIIKKYIPRKYFGFFPAVGIFGGAKCSEMSELYDLAYKVSNHFALLGNSIITGGGGGVMEAANKAAALQNQCSIGIGVKNFEQEFNKFCSPGLTFKADNFSERKMLMVHLSKAFVFLPGGFGTLDELFEVLVLLRTKSISGSPLFLVNSDFWLPLLSWLKSSVKRNRFIEEKDLNYIKLIDRIDDCNLD